MASRGPRGSLQLMLAIRDYHIVASIGAFVTVTALAIDPFTQQTLRYYSCSMPSQGVNATIPRTSAYDLVGIREVSTVNTLDAGMQSAINSGLYNPTMGKIVNFECSTGNCTFPQTYQSIGYCSQCTNISAQIMQSPSNATIPSLEVFTNYSLQSGLWATNNLGNDTISFAVATSQYNTQYSAVDVACVRAEQRQNLVNNGYNVSSDSAWTWYNATSLTGTYNENGNGGLTPPAQASKVNIDCLYGVYEDSSFAINAFMQTYFKGSIVPYNDGFNGPSVLQQLYQQGNASIASVSLAMENVAQSVSAYIRQNGAVNVSAPAVGVVYQQNTCVRIKWGWLAFPAMLIVLTVLFLALMILDNGRQPPTCQDWKSSLLPLLFHGLDRDAVAQYDAVEPTEKGAMQDIAKAMRVWLGPSGQGWKFIKLD